MKKKTTILSLVVATMAGSAYAEGELNLYSSRHYDTDERLYSDFTEATGITIKFSIVQEFDTELQSRAQSKDLPDMWINDDVLLGSYQRQGFIAELSQDNYPESSAISDELWNTVKMTDGLTYAIPYSRQTMVDCFRSDWLENLGLEAPTTWDEYVDFLDACYNDDPDGDDEQNTYGSAVAATAENGYAARWGMSYIWQAGGSFWTDNGDGTFTVETTAPETVKAVEWLQSLFSTKGRVQPDAITATTSVCGPFFTEGKTGHTLTGPYAFSGFDEAPGADVYTVVPAPVGPKDGAVLAEGENIYISVDTENTDAVQKVVEWFMSEEGQKTCMTNSVQPVVRVPVRSDLDAAEVYGDERWAVAQSNLENSKTFPAQADVSAIKSTIAESLNVVFASPEEDPTSELENLKTKLEDIFADLEML